MKLLKENNNIKNMMVILLRIYGMIIAFSWFILAFYSIVHADNGDTIVHVTNTGTHYHTAGCYHLQSDKEITLYEAVVENGYIPCDDCNPPVYDGPAKLHEQMEEHQGGGEGTSSSSGGESGNGTSNHSYSSTYTTNSNSNNRETSDEYEKPGLLLCMIGVGIAFFLPGCFVIGMIKSAKTKSITKKQEQEEFERARQMYYSMYAGKSPLSFVQAPPGAFVKNDLPCTEGDNIRPHGDYTVFIGKNANVLHMNPKCGGANLDPVNYSLVCKLPHCKRCATGKITLPRLEWFVKYSEIENIKRKYNIP